MQNIKHKFPLFTVLGFVVFNLALHMYADSHAGYHGDELMHIDAGRHLAFGYADFPPVIGVLAFLQNL
ncbi:MAG: hypothetical protein MJA31_11015, partial [Clostridia bacterium]|nr:hypothetical protein [Clostridia bacterium]